MLRSSHYSGVIAAIMIALAGYVFLNWSPTYNPPPANPVTSSSTVSVEIPAEVLAATTSPKVASTTPVQKKAAKPVQKVAAPSAPVAPVQSAEEINAALAASADKIRGTLVNILCSAPRGTRLHAISGSGIIVDPKGIVLTNAHVAEYLLLADKGVSCTIRSGSPASPRYDSALMYISPAWVKENVNVLTEAEPTGNGEHDFALLAITKSLTQNPLPSSFPYVSLVKTVPPPSTPVVIASYAAQFITSDQISSSLFPTIVYGSIKNVFTFNSGTADVLSLGGSAAAQEGSSGGGVIDASGELVGTITTSTVTGATDTRSLNAISAPYIRADYATDTGQPLDLLLSQSPSTAVASFASQIKSLESLINAQLQ